MGADVTGRETRKERKGIKRENSAREMRERKGMDSLHSSPVGPSGVYRDPETYKNS